MSNKIIFCISLIIRFFLLNTYEIEITDYNTAQTFFIHKSEILNINFFSQINPQNDLMVSMHSINCKIKINFNDSESSNHLIKQKNEDIFSFRLNKDSIKETTIKVSTLVYSTNEREEKNTKNKTCPVVITNFYIPENEYPTLNLTNLSHIYFDENLKIIKIMYYINELGSDEPIGLSISFDKKTTFEIKVEGNETINKNISHSTNIFFKSQYYKGDNISIEIKHIDETTPVFISLKMIKNISISILEQNNLNLGFISSKIKYQYYFMEVFKEQEGEIMLHNKRQKGELFAVLIKKEEIFNLYDINIYPKLPEQNQSNSTNSSNSYYFSDSCYSLNLYDSSNLYLEFNHHTAKLYFNYENTSKCENGCYLLMTYYKEIIDDSLPLVGYEYTILSRIWDCFEYSPQIINIPFNEYILGSFDEHSITHHYYSIFIPEDTEKIIIQIESNYLDAFIGEGITKLNTIKILKEIVNLDIYKNQEVFILSKDNMKFNFTNNYISLALRSKDFFEEIFSFYYFRILYLKKGEILYYPLDSYIGNLCLPEEENEKYICNIVLENNYNEFSSNFSVSGSNEIEYFEIKYAPLFKNSTMGKYNNIEFRYLYTVDNNTYQDIDKYFFRYEFSTKGIKNILSAFSEHSTEDYLKIYSSRMFHLFRQELIINFSLKNKYTLTFKHLGGWFGWTELNYIEFQNIATNRNFRGKPIAIQITNNKRMKFWCTTFDFSFYLKLSYNMVNKGIEEITSKETRSEIIKDGMFPLYYYLNATSETSINIDINIRLNSYNATLLQNNFEIKGFIVDEDSIKRKIRGETIILNEEESILGSYMECYNFGYLQIKRNYMKNNEYVLIRITNNNHTYINSYFLVEIVAHEYQNSYFMPINQYLIDSFYSNYNYTRNINKYYIDINNLYRLDKERNSTILIEFSPNYNDLELNFETDDVEKMDYFVTGFQKFRITNSSDNIIYFNVNNTKNRTNANYYLRYYYSDEDEENNFIFNPDFIYQEDKSDSESVSISLIFKNIDIFLNLSRLNTSTNNYNITYNIFGYLFEKNGENDEQVNVSTLIHKKPLYEAKAKVLFYYNDSFKLSFDKILRKHNYIYNLQLKVNAHIARNIFDEELLAFSTVLDLRNIDNINNNSDNTLIFILVGVIVAIFIILIILFFVYRRVRRNNSELKEKVLSITYSSGIEKNVLKEKINAQKDDDDYETTFI